MSYNSLLLNDLKSNTENKNSLESKVFKRIFVSIKSIFSPHNIIHVCTFERNQTQPKVQNTWNYIIENEKVVYLVRSESNFLEMINNRFIIVRFIVVNTIDSKFVHISSLKKIDIKKLQWIGKKEVIDDSFFHSFFLGSFDNVHFDITGRFSVSEFARWPWVVRQ